MRSGNKAPIFCLFRSGWVLGPHSSHGKETGMLWLLPLYSPVRFILKHVGRKVARKWKGRGEGLDMDAGIKESGTVGA